MLGLKLIHVSKIGTWCLDRNIQVKFDINAMAGDGLTLHVVKYLVTMLIYYVQCGYTRPSSEYISTIKQCFDVYWSCESKYIFMFAALKSAQYFFNWLLENFDLP